MNTGQLTCPKWVKDYPFLEALLNALVSKLDQGKKPCFTIRKKTRLFAPLYDFSSGEADQLWRLLQALEHETQVIQLQPPKKPPQHWETEYEGYKVSLNPAREKLLRDWLARPAFDPYRLTWQEALKKHEAALVDCREFLYENPLRIADRSAAEVVAAFARIAQVYADHKKNIPYTMRELSAQCFWGNSKYMEQHRMLFDKLFPRLSVKLQTRPLMVEAHVPQNFSQVLFIENQDTFLNACNQKYSGLAGYALIYSAGFRISQQKGRGQYEAVFAYIKSNHSASIAAFEDWWFKRTAEQKHKSMPVFFWGDLDFAGMGILASLRCQFPAIQAWPVGYDPMLQALWNQIGHTAAEADKLDQIDPIETGCQYADTQLLPALRQTKRFIDQEWCVDLDRKGDC